MKVASYSLRFQLLGLLIIPIIASGALAGALALSSVRIQVNELLDAQLRQNAQILFRLTQGEIEEHDKNGIDLKIDRPDFSYLYDRKLSYRIWQGNKMITEGYGADVFPFGKVPAGISITHVKNESWRIFSFHDEKYNITVEVAESDGIRAQLIRKMIASIYYPGLIFVNLVVAIIWYGTTRSLRPMEELAQQVNQRNADDLTPLRAEMIANEISPFITALDRLFLRVQETLRREREFTDNAAHELRTPLAAMKMQSQALLRSRATDAEGPEIHQLLQGIDRATGLVDQLLTFARLQGSSGDFEMLDMSELVRSEVAELVPLALKKGQDIAADIAPELTMPGNAGALRILIRNLVDNAIKYSPYGAHILVRLCAGREGYALEVTDNGPGIPQELHGKIFERFYRVHKSQGTGSGLGLAMVKWIADMHDGLIEVRNTHPRGLQIKIIFKNKQWAGSASLQCEKL